MSDISSENSPLGRIDLLEHQVGQLNRAVFGDSNTRTDSLYVRLDRLQFTIDRINGRFMWLWGILFFLMGLLVLVIIQILWHAMIA